MDHIVKYFSRVEGSYWPVNRNQELRQPNQLDRIIPSHFIREGNQVRQAWLTNLFYIQTCYYELPFSCVQKWPFDFHWDWREADQPTVSPCPLAIFPYSCSFWLSSAAMVLPVMAFQSWQPATLQCHHPALITSDPLCSPAFLYIEMSQKSPALILFQHSSFTYSLNPDSWCRDLEDLISVKTKAREALSNSAFLQGTVTKSPATAGPCFYLYSNIAEAPLTAFELYCPFQHQLSSHFPKIIPMCPENVVVLLPL